MSPLERLTKLIVLLSVLFAVSAAAWGAYLAWPANAILVPAAFVAAWVAGRFDPESATSLTLGACCLVPAGFIFMSGGFSTAEWSVWLAAVCGLVMATAPPLRWSLPGAWRVPLVFWALIAALTWPVVALREANFEAAWMDATMLVWVSTTALIVMVGILWFDSLFAAFAVDGRPPLDLERRVVLPLGIGWLVAGCVGLYQMLGHIDFLNDGFWSLLHRATGTLNEANVFGVLSAMWGGALLALAFDTEKRWHRAAGVAALLLSWAAVWASGSRSALVIVALAAAAIVVQSCRRYGLRRSAVGLAVMAPLGAAVAVAIVVFARGSAIGPGARFVRDFAPSASWAWASRMAMSLWTRGEYGPVAGLMIRRFPVAGVGIGGFHYVWASFSWLVFHAPVPVDNAQNWYRHELAELGVAGSLGWIWWGASMGWLLVTAKALPERQLTSGVVRAVLIGFGLISLVGVPGQEIAVAFAMWTMTFWFLRTTAPSSGAGARPVSAVTWALALAIAAGYTALTVYDARTILRPPARAIMADMDYSLGFYDAEGAIDGVSYRWTRQHALAVIATPDPWLRLSIWVNHPDIAANPVDARVWRNGKQIMQVHLTTDARETIYLRVPSGETGTILETRVSRVEYAPDPRLPRHREQGLLVMWTPVTTPPPGAVIAQ